MDSVPHNHHPDLMDLGSSLQRRLDRVLEAEQEAAAVLARRSATLRDRLLEAEDAGEVIQVRTASGLSACGRLMTVATDHIELHLGPSIALVSLADISTVHIT